MSKMRGTLALISPLAFRLASAFQGDQILQGGCRRVEPAVQFVLPCEGDLHGMCRTFKTSVRYTGAAKDKWEELDIIPAPAGSHCHTLRPPASAATALLSSVFHLSGRCLLELSLGAFYCTNRDRTQGLDWQAGILDRGELLCNQM